MSGRTGFVAIPRDLRKRLPNPRDRAAALELALDAAWGEFSTRRRRVNPGETAISLASAAELWGCSVKQARGIVARLLRAGLIETMGREDRRSSSRTVYRVKFLVELGHAEGHAEGHAGTRVQSGRAGQVGHTEGHAKGQGKAVEPESRTRQTRTHPPPSPPQLALLDGETATAPGKQRRLRTATATALPNSEGLDAVLASYPSAEERGHQWPDDPRRTERAWRRARMRGATVDGVLAAIAAWRETDRWKRGYSPLLCNFLDRDHWFEPPEAELARQSIAGARRVAGSSAHPDGPLSVSDVMHGRLRQDDDRGYGPAISI